MFFPPPLLLLLLFLPSVGLLHGLPALEVSGGGPQGRHHSAAPDLFRFRVDAAELRQPDPHEGRAVEQDVLGRVRFFFADNASALPARQVAALWAVQARVPADPVHTYTAPIRTSGRHAVGELPLKFPGVYLSGMARVAGLP